LFLLLYGEDVFAKGQKIDLGGKSTINGATVTFTHVENAYGASKADRITGDATANSLGGLGGNDILEGRGGADRLLGAAGKDVFVYARAADSNGKQHDTIVDFKHNQDRIDLGALHPDTKNDKFTFIDDGKFDKHAGELHVVHKQGITMVEADLDGNGKADLQIELTGNIHLDKGDFIL
jgi:Ca2+-binding RTX toxin-like protein